MRPQTTTIFPIIASLAIVGAAAYFLLFHISPSPENFTGVASLSPNVEIREGVQYVTITAQGGYSPRISNIQPDMPTKLIIKTNGTYDCSAALVIRQVGFQKILQPTDEEIVDLGIIKKGDKIQGTCSMGMYGFELKSG